MTDDQDEPTRLPVGSVVPGADIWDEDDGWDDDDDQQWLHDAQVVAHADDAGPHDGSRGVEVDEDPELALGSKIQRWAGASALGASLAGFGVAIEKVLFDRDPTQIEIQAEADDNDHLDPVEVKLDADHPELSKAVLRPWLNDT